MKFYPYWRFNWLHPLYNALHKLDQLKLDVIIAEDFHGLGRTNDRLEGQQKNKLS
jgi:hypothetical protein